MTKEREFIFPMNYKKKEKFLGVVDYKTIVVISIFAFFIFLILKNIEIGLLIKVSIFITVVGFFTVLILVGVNGENMLDFLYFMGKYLINEKVYVYRKTDEKEKKVRCINLLKHGFK